jgi:transcription antitermination factor NusG
LIIFAGIKNKKLKFFFSWKEGEILRTGKRNDCRIKCQSDANQSFQNEGEPEECLFFGMTCDDENIKWFVLFAANGKAAKISDYLKLIGIEYFYPMFYQERRIRNSERTKRFLQPVFKNLLFIKSTKLKLDPVLQEIKLKFGITSDLYYRYRDGEERKIIVIPAAAMRNFMAVVGAVEEPVIYFSNEDVNLAKGTGVRITGGVFEGIEGIFMRVKGDRRIVVSLPNLFSVATAFVPLEYILPLECKQRKTNKINCR